MQVGRSEFTFMEVSGSFHESTRKFPLSVEMEASIASIDCSFHNGRFHELPYNPTYFRLHPRISRTSSCFHKTNSNPNLKLELPPWKLAYSQLPWKQMEVHGSSLLPPWKLELLARKLGYFEIPWKLAERYVSRQKPSWT